MAPPLAPGVPPVPWGEPEDPEQDATHIASVTVIDPAVLIVSGSVLTGPKVVRFLGAPSQGARGFGDKARYARQPSPPQVLEGAFTGAAVCVRRSSDPRPRLDLHSGVPRGDSTGWGGGPSLATE